MVNNHSWIGLRPISDRGLYRSLAQASYFHFRQLTADEQKTDCHRGGPIADLFTTGLTISVRQLVVRDLKIVLSEVCGRL